MGGLDSVGCIGGRKCKMDRTHRDTAHMGGVAYARHAGIVGSTGGIGNVTCIKGVRRRESAGFTEGVGCII